MSVCRRQALIDAPPERIWDLVGDPQRHPEWWPRVVEVSGQRFEQGSTYAQVTRQPRGEIRTTISVERLDDVHAIHMRCLDTGTFTRWLLTEAQGSTFVDVEFGMDPTGIRDRMLDAAIGKLYFRRWLEQSMIALEEVATVDYVAVSGDLAG
jgi:uncharacterized protein YndB with AHSA1/START domain